MSKVSDCDPQKSSSNQLASMNFEDLSTLGGGDWDDDSATATVPGTVITDPSIASEPQRVSHTVISNNEIGDIGEEDLAADKAAYYADNAMIVDGFKCPDDFLGNLTPMEFEEMVVLFQTFDADKSGTIDKHEAKKVLHFLGLDADLEKAEEYMAIVDTDKSGEIEFDEFCNFVVMVKRGDERVAKFSNIIAKIGESPLFELERQVKNRNLKIQFRHIEERAPSLTQPTVQVMEVTLTGHWFDIVDGESKSSFGVKRYQGMGGTTKDAKYDAATIAILKMGTHLPGVQFVGKEFPSDWVEWVEKNLLRGVAVGKIATILATKGFQPYRNTKLMHKLLSWSSLDILLHAHPDIDIGEVHPVLDNRFFRWATETAQKGVDGMVILDMLFDRELDLMKEEPFFAQKLRNNEMSSIVGP